MKSLPILLPIALFGLATGLGCSRPDEPKTATKVEVTKPKYNFSKPDHVRGIYLTAWTASSQRRLSELLDLIDRTELNAVVVDIRDAGKNFWKVDIALSDEAKATEVAIRDPEALMKLFEERGVYPIARIACFRDNYVPKARPELAVQNPDGKPWADGGKYMWLDPYNKKNWEYIAEIVDFALEVGFPEIQLDYVRFPSEGVKKDTVFPAKKEWKDPETTQSDVIVKFAEFIGERVRKKKAVFSADVFGIISQSKKDQGIGQILEHIAQPFDLLCPMVYPSHYARGEYGIAHPNASPYETVKRSVADFIRRVPETPLRPWLQDFSLYGVSYGKEQVQAQIKALKELGIEEYLLWNPRNVYTEDAIVDNSKLAVKDPEPPAREQLERPNGSQ